ncbi:hypothetical protein F5Y11DRAFT_315884 [Daldinia sp. FL1419]|nr:hypothetical protein F5Y11DRAFT_315884 [Daldinia sp. FL1419]
MSSAPQSDTNILSNSFSDNPQDYGGQPGQPDQLGRSFSGQDDLSSQSLLIAPIQSFQPDLYTHAPSSLGQPLTSVGANSDQGAATSLARDVPWDIGVPSFSQAENTDLQLTTTEVEASVPEARTMRHLHSDLAVLNAEQYDTGRNSRRPTSKVNRKPNNTIVPVAENVTNPRKRGRKSADRELDGPAEETKRSRGRPRLETKDQTPTERRRTQIRLAQRAYRNRKENAITDLQAKIDDLQSVNNEINDAYKNLFNYASQQGLLAQAPEFGQQLQKLQALVKQSQERESSQADEHDSPEEPPDEGQREVHASDPADENEEPASALLDDQTPALWGGIVVSHEPIIPPELTATSSLDPLANSAQHHNYEVITAPTLENASFGPNFSVDPNFLDPAQTSWARHPWNRLTGPHTMSFNEWTFARRLHRHTLERAAALISMPSPPPGKLTRVFGFVMLFETVEEIRSRTVAMLDRERNDPLNYWKYPFHRLGGSGTHFPDQGQPSLSGSSSYQSTGFGTGPFNERTTRVRDTMLGVSQYINMSGWEGTWFDSDEVETYLAQNGVVIPPVADIHTVEIHLGAFSDVQTHPNAANMQNIHPNATHIPHIDAAFAVGISGAAPPTTGDPTFSTGPDAMSSSMVPHSVPGNSWSSIPTSSGFYGGDHHTAETAAPFAGFDSMAANTFVSPSPYYFPQHQSDVPTPVPPPRRVVLDVNQFIAGETMHPPPRLFSGKD